MDPSTRLDHAVFQLTPTRTRCDLLVCSEKGVYEKIASGLLEPFLSHLRCAREQIPKGGYSFTLRPPPATRGSPSGGGRGASGGSRGDDEAAASPLPIPSNWFTKGTLERFVRFVSTPEILERVATIEKEIVHIESCCVHPAASEDGQAAAAATTEANGAGTGKAAEHHGSSSSHSSGDDNSRKWNSPSKLKVEANEHDATHGENSKLCLQQTLEIRKAVLLKEQGMAYARATVAGYEIGSIDDLVSFADAFGGSRLREACMNFKDICEKKENDKIWMDELAAIGTRTHSELSCIGPSGIMLTGEPIHSLTNHSLARLEAVTGDHPELNGACSDTVTDPTIPAPTSYAGQDNNGQMPSREPWISSSNGIYNEKCQIPIGWPSHPPQYMYNFQNAAQQMPPYQGYAFPGTLPPYPLGQFDGAQQPPFKEVSDNIVGGDAYSRQGYHMPSSANHSKPARMKTSRSITSGSRNGERSHDSSKSGSESDGQIDHDDSEEEVLGKGWGRKRSNKKSSKTVVIRNINYISSERRDGEDGSTSGSSVEGGINEDFLKEKVENIVGSLKKYHRTSHKRKGKNKNHRNIHDDDDNSFDHNAEIDANTKASNTKGDESWNAFQSILMRDESSSTELHGKNNIVASDSNEQYHVYSGDDIHVVKNAHLAASFAHNFSLETESLKGTRQRLAATDPIAANAKDDNYKSKGCSQIFDCDESYSTIMRRSHNADEELPFSERSRSEIATPDDITAYADETVTPNLQRDADCFIVSKSSSLQHGEHTTKYSMFEGEQNIKSLDGVSYEKTINELPVDDSFVVATRSTADEHPISQWGTDMSIISGLAFSPEAEGVEVASHPVGNNREPDNHEPDDLQMVLERSTGSEPVGASWTPEIDYTPDITFNVMKESDSVHKANGSTVPPTVAADPKGTFGEANSRNKLPVKDAKSKSIHGSLTKTKPVVVPRNKKPSMMSRDEIQRNKMMKEEENRRRLEDLMIQRQKRIAERSSSVTAPTAMTKVSAAESKLGTGSSKHEKKTPRPIQGNSRPSLPHRMEVTSSTKNSHAPDQFEKNGKVAAMAM